MKIYLQMDGHALVEYVEKAEYDLLRFLPDYLKSELKAANEILADSRAKICQLEHELNQAKQELKNAVKRMEAVPVQELDRIWGITGDCELDGFEGVRARLIEAAKGES
jgi:septal ring factor EnvC (AmiA/AmiB activator)